MSELSTATAALTLAASEMKDAKESFEDIRADVNKSALEASNFIDQISQDVNAVVHAAMIETVYVSHNGSDTNSGLSTDSPVKTLAKAFQLVPVGGQGLVKLALIKDSQDVPLMYPVDTGIDVGSKNIILCSWDGSGNGIKVFQGGAFTVRSGGSLKFANPYQFSIYIDADRTSDAVVYGYGGCVQFGGYYTVKLINESNSLKYIVKATYHTGDNKTGSSFCNASFCRFNSTESIENNFSLVGGYLSCFIMLNAWSCVIDDESLIYSNDLWAFQIPESSGYLLSI